MGIVVWLVLLLLAGGAGVAWHRSRYPGSWAHAFGEAHVHDRQSLAQARQAVRDLEREAHQERSGAEAQVRNAKSQYQQRINAAEHQLGELRQPGRGGRVGQLGRLVLHKHVLVVATEEVPLAGLTVRFEEARTNTHIYLTQPTGKVRYESYPREEHEEEEVRRFAVWIENEVAEENIFRGQRKRLMAQAEAELREAQSDTTSHEAARLRLAEVSSKQQKDKRLAAARLELEAARERWRAVSGRRPQ